MIAAEPLRIDAAEGVSCLGCLAVVVRANAP